MRLLTGSQMPGFSRPSVLCFFCMISQSSYACGRRSWSSRKNITTTCFRDGRRDYSARQTDSVPSSTEATPADATAHAAKRSQTLASKRSRPKGRNLPGASQGRIQLWRETLDVLKKIEAAAGRLEDQSHAPPDVVTTEGASKNEQFGVESKRKRRKKAVAAVAAAPPVPDSSIEAQDILKTTTEKDKQHTGIDSQKSGRGQVKKLTSALHLLRKVLNAQVPDPDTYGSSEGDGGPASAQARTPGWRPNNKRRGSTVAVANEFQRQSSKSPATQPEQPEQPELQEQQQQEDLQSFDEQEEAVCSTKKLSAPPTTSQSSKRGQGQGQATKKKPSCDGQPGDSKAEASQLNNPFAALVKSGKSPYRVSKINSRFLKLAPVDENKRPVPKLHYGLDRALFNPGVYHLQDPRSRVYNFDPYLSTIMPVKEFDFNALKQYVTSSKDPTLISMAAKYKMKYSGSTSSMTSMLSHFHFLLSGWRPINPAHTSRAFSPESLNFTRITKAPAAVFLHWKDGVYAIDADKEFDTANILSMLGKSMEKLLTLSKRDFEKYRITKSHMLTKEERNDPESFHYSTFGDFMMRSQLDAHDNRLPGTGMFDLKTRAVVSIRMDAHHFQRGLGYEIRSRIGQWESFEREYFDMIRSAFLKYSLQVRMGRMDGIYVAFHNTQRIFGFQYISINEMDLALHGSEDRTLGDREFMVSLKMLNAILDKATERFPGRSIRLHIETRPSEVAPFMYVFAKPVTLEDISRVQDANKASVEAFEKRMLGITTEEVANEARAAIEKEDGQEQEESEDGNENENDNEQEEEEEEEEGEGEEEEDVDDDGQSFNVWESMRQKVEQTIENETLGVASVRDTIEDALEQSGLLRGRSSSEILQYVNALLEAIMRPDSEMVAETLLKEGNENGEGEAEVKEDADGGSEGVVVDNEASYGFPQKEPAETSIVDVDSSEPQSNTPSDINNLLRSAHSESQATFSSQWGSPSLLELDAEAEGEEEGGNKQEKQPSTSLSTEDEGRKLADDSVSAKDTEEAPGSMSRSSSDMLSLKDLIIKLAAQVEVRSDRGMDRDDDVKDTTMDGDSEVAEAPKNKRFERILSEMMALSKETATAGDAAVSSPPPQVGKSTAATTSGSATTDTENTEAKKDDGTTTNNPGKDNEDELLGMIVTIRNKVNGRYVKRPDQLSKTDSWVVEYAIEEIQPAQRAKDLYGLLKKRRKGLLSPKDTKVTSFDRHFMSKLHSLSAKGRSFRKVENAQAKTRPVRVYGFKRDMGWHKVFKNNIEG